MSCGGKSYTNESFQKAKYYMSITVLQQSRNDNWTICDCLKKQVELFKQLNTPLEVALSLHTKITEKV